MGRVVAVRPAWQRDWKGRSGDLGKGSGFILNEMEVTGPYKISSCGGFYTAANTTSWRGGSMTLPLNLGALATKQQKAVEVMLHLIQCWATKGHATVPRCVATFALGSLTAAYLP